MRIKNKQIEVLSDFDINNNKLINVDNPTGLQDAATKAYVDGIVGSPAVPTILNKEMTSAVITGTDNTSTTLAIAATPANDGYVAVLLNGAQQVLGNGTKLKDCYFSADGGATAKSIAAIVATDILYWNAVITGINIDALDKFDFNYNV